MSPFLTMRTLSEEKRTGTIEMLLSAPVADWQVVLAKFLGAWTSYAALWATTLIFFVILRVYVPLDWGPILTGYLGTWLSGAALVSVGVLASSLTRNQVIAVVVGFVLMLLIFLVGFLGGLMGDPASRAFIEYLSLLEQMRDFSKGILDSRPIAFYLTLTAAALFLAIRTIANPRWRA
jgi:ABC-2 type transport system permease protein